MLYVIRVLKNKMRTIGAATISNEAVRCEYISIILVTSTIIIQRITNQKISLSPQFKIVDDEACGQVNYAIKRIKEYFAEIMAVTEGKQKDLLLGILQNAMQLESSHYTNTKKRKRSDTFSDSFN